MARKSLRPHLNQIRSWVRQGRTDAWVAHQLEVPVQDISEFKRNNELLSDSEPGEGGADFPEEIDLRAEDDALVAAELEAAALEAERERALEEEREKAAKEEKEREKAKKKAEAEANGDLDEDDDEDDDEATPRRRRSRRGGRGRRPATRGGATLEGSFDHGEEGYGLWLDPAIQDDPIYAEHWAGHRPIEVTIEEEQIVIRRVSEDS
ncbi:MAG TPA: hypothetical protein VGF95_13530 [Solirubrobacteraceae bacterium]|jgi:hypothetical protein